MADETDAIDEIEYAPATRVRVLETNVLHVNDVVYWLDGSSAEDLADMQRVDHLLQLVLTERPRDLRVVHKPGLMALWRRAEDGMVPGTATEAQRERTPVPPFTVAGEVSDPGRRFNPARFDLSLGSGAGTGLVLYPTPFGTTLTDSGGVFGSLRQAGSGETVPWALLELEVELSAVDSQVYRAQADRHGDFVIALTRLPPLPDSVTEYDAILRVSAGAVPANATAPDLAGFAIQELESGDEADDFATEFILTVRPGDLRRINSFDKSHVAVQPA